MTLHLLSVTGAPSHCHASVCCCDDDAPYQGYACLYEQVECRTSLCRQQAAHLVNDNKKSLLVAAIRRSNAAACNHQNFLISTHLYQDGTSAPEMTCLSGQNSSKVILKMKEAMVTGRQADRANTSSGDQVAAQQAEVKSEQRVALQDAWDCKTVCSHALVRWWQLSVLQQLQSNNL